MATGSRGMQGFDPVGEGFDMRLPAAVLLLHSDEPVTSIGRAVGWPDQSGFARRFKAHYGLSATTYRKRFATRAAHLHHPVADAS